MTIAEIVKYHNVQQGNVGGSGVFNTARDIPPLNDLLSKYFMIRNFGTAKEIADNIMLADKDPNVKLSMVTQSYLQLPEEMQNPELGKYVQSVLWEWLKGTYTYTGKNLSVIKNSVIYSLLDTNNPNDKTIKMSNIVSMSPSDITKQLSGGIGYHLIDAFSTDMKSNKLVILKLIRAIGIYYLNGNLGIPQQDCRDFINLLFESLTSMDGFIEENRILKTLTEISGKDINNASEKNKPMDKMNNGGMNFGYNNFEGMKFNRLPLYTAEDLARFVQNYSQLVSRELASLANTPVYKNSIDYTTLVLTKVIPLSIIEDIDLIIKGQSPKYNITELSAIHLNSLILRNFVNYYFFKGSCLFLSNIISYSIVTTLVRKNPNVLSQRVNISADVIRIIQTLGFAVNTNVNDLVIGKVNLKDTIKLDMTLKTNGFYIETYSVIHNDISLRDPLVKRFISVAANSVSPQIILANIKQSYPAAMRDRYKSVNLDYLDTFLSSIGMTEFTSAASDNMRSFLNIYVDYLADEIRILDQMN